MGKMIVDLEPGESIRIGSDTIVTMEHKSGRRARLVVNSEYRVETMRPPAVSRPNHTPQASAKPALQRPVIPGK